MEYSNGLPRKTKTYQQFEEKGQIIKNKMLNNDKALWGELAALNILYDFIYLENISLVDEILDRLMGFAGGCENNGLLLSLGAHCFAVSNVYKNFIRESDVLNKYLQVLTTGEVIAAFAATEQNAGSDIMSMKTNFSEENDIVLNGEKCYITNATIADEFIIFATQDPRLRDRGLSVFKVPKNIKGISVIPCYSPNGLQEACLGSIQLESVHIPSSQLIGKKNSGGRIFQKSMLFERIFLQAFQVGLMRNHLDKSIRYSQKRRQFGKKIGSYQFILEHINVIYEKYITSYYLVKEAIKELHNNTLNNAQASLTKLYISEASVIVHMKMMRILAGKEYLCRDGATNNNFLDTFGNVIYSGTSEIHKIIIGTELGVL